jgi:hypothetical protein
VVERRVVVVEHHIVVVDRLVVVTGWRTALSCGLAIVDTGALVGMVVVLYPCIQYCAQI